MKSTHTATLHIPQLSKVANAAHVFPAMEKNSLLSMGQLCDEGYFVLFSTDGVKILNEKTKTHHERSQGSCYRIVENQFVTKKSHMHYFPASISASFSQ
jgi:hypothetical protein